MTTPIAVLISDIHYTPATLEVASKSVRLAIDKARELRGSLIVCGDLLDSKAIIRAECANRVIEDLGNYGRGEEIIVLVGNHDLINQHGKEHALEFLRPYCDIVNEAAYRRFNLDMQSYVGLHLLPYINDPAKFVEEAQKIPPGEILICHQGFRGAQMGHYVVDKSNVNPDDVKHLRIISGHYHKRQDLGTVSYVGNPYTLSFGEAHDGPKGFRILLSDGNLDFVPVPARKHVVVDLYLNDRVECSAGDLEDIRTEDLVWAKVYGNVSDLDKITRPLIKEMLRLPQDNFKLDLLPHAKMDPAGEERKDLTPHQVLDSLIESQSESQERKQTLKATWRQLLNENSQSERS